MKIVILFFLLTVSVIGKSQCASWVKKANFGGTNRAYATGFVIGGKGYVGTGSAGAVTYYKDFWQYDTTTNSWTQKANFGGTARNQAISFTIGSFGVINSIITQKNLLLEEMFEELLVSKGFFKCGVQIKKHYISYYLLLIQGYG